MLIEDQGQICIAVLSVCRLFEEDDMVIDPLELLGRRVDFQIHVAECLGVKWLRDAAGRGIQIGYCVAPTPCFLRTSPFCAPGETESRFSLAPGEVMSLHKPLFLLLGPLSCSKNLTLNL